MTDSYGDLASSLMQISNILKEISGGDDRETTVYTKRGIPRYSKRLDTPFSEEEFKKMMASGNLEDFLERYNIGKTNCMF